MVEQHCAAHLGHALDEPLEFEPELQLDTPAGQYFLRLVKLFAEELTLARLDGCAHPLANAHVAEHFASTLLNALLYGQQSNISEALGRPETAAAPHFVRRVEDYIRRHHAEPLTIEKLAGVAGVSTRTLFAGFRDFRRVSPMTYLKSLRLDKARQALQSGEVGGVAGVTKVALDNGFSHLGRFAKHYRSRFGELPSATARMKPGPRTQRLGRRSLARITSVPIPKFAGISGSRACELWNQRDTRKSIVLVRFFGFEVPTRACRMILGTSNPPH